MAGPDSVEEVARAIRRRIIRMAHAGRTPHVASALSCVDVLAALYFETLRIDPAAPEDEARDRFILSKGHGCMALYATLAERGFFPEEVLGEYARDGGRLAEHPARHCVPGIEVATGSLGHGLSLGAGLALAAKIRKQSHRIFVMLSDGECAEGSVWEAALFGSARGLDNLIGIVDYNKWSAMGPTRPYLEPLSEKWKAFGWSCVEINGHDASAIIAALSRVPSKPSRPTVVIAHTIKGKGVSFMENDLGHYRPPSNNDLMRALLEIDGGQQ
jgi:transketolase